MSVREYAQYRKQNGLPGGTRNAVEKALKTGRIRRGKDGKIHPRWANAQWDKNTDPSKQPKKSAATGAFADARTLREEVRAESESIDLKVKQGKLVDADKVTADYFRIARMIRDKIEAVPGRISAELTSLAKTSDARTVEKKLSDELRLALESLADDLTT